MAISRPFVVKKKFDSLGESYFASCFRMKSAMM